ncbi:MAG: aldo/keto reductase [bacterium]|jgi:aryl-alcohol dehydrogenase-like predicted oxidoreductase|nr:aldo/keto reductase [bacterium]
MLYKQFHDLRLSQLMLGTVQLGMNYGIANRSGRPSYKEARDIIACAYEGGVNCLDTAASYGDSEEIIGRALAELGLTDKIIIITKVAPVPQEVIEAGKAEEFISRSVITSLKRLRLDVLPICLFHREENVECMAALLQLKERGLLRHAGVSVMATGATWDIIGSGQAEALQIPANLLDHSFVRQGICDLAARKGMAVFVRSIYLQGLLIMDEKDIPADLREEVLPVIRILRQLAGQAGLSLSEMALRYVLGLPGVTALLAGAEKVEQVRQNISMVAGGALPRNLMEAISNVVPNFPDRVIVPAMWHR